MKFDIKRDLAIITVGGFWCKACLSGKPAAEQSPDSHYCRKCFDILLAEAAQDTRRKPWHPRGAVLAVAENAKDVVTTDERVEDVTTQLVTSPDNVINAKIAALDAAGLKARDISEKLAKQGISVSYRTVYRRLKEKQGALV